MSKKMKIQSSKDVDVKYSELCDCDEIYVVTIGDNEFQVSYRNYSEIPEPQIWHLGDDKDELICTTKKLSKTKKIDTIKTAFIAYMLGKKMLELV